MPSCARPYRGEIRLNTTVALETILNSLLELGVVSPLAAAGLRGRTSPDRLRLLGISAVVVVSTLVATCLPQIIGFEPAGLHWNWAGKLACVAVLMLIAWLLPRKRSRGRACYACHEKMPSSRRARSSRSAHSSGGLRALRPEFR